MDARIEDILQLFRRDIRRPLHPSDLAAEVGLSVSRFYDLFRKATGTSPCRYLRYWRFERAKSLLLTTHLSIKEIVNQTGFRDDSHFVRDFQAT